MPAQKVRDIARSIGRRTVRLPVGIGLIGILAFSGGLVYAAIPNSTTGVINGCFEKYTGLLRVIDTQAGKTCTRWETPISWNQVGPAGEPGLQGQTGPQGEPGEDGEDADTATLESTIDVLAAALTTLATDVESLRAGALDLAGQSCPAGQFLTGFDSAGALLCSAADGDAGPTEDVDGDGYTVAEGDCNDLNDRLHPGAPPDPVRLLTDTNCDGQIDEVEFSVALFDLDADGILASIDCNDHDPTIGTSGRVHYFPEVPGDGVDNDCNGLTDEAADVCLSGDPYVVSIATDGSCTYMVNADLDHDADGLDVWPSGGDCDDTDPTTHYGAVELPDGVDNDCDGVADDGVSSLGILGTG